jgi:hypothetical protein
MRRTVSAKTLWVLRQFFVVALGIVVYFGVRGLTAAAPAVAQEHADHVVRLEARLGLEREHTVQALLVGRDWLLDVANWVYIWGHWPVITLVMVWLAMRHSEQFLRLRNAMIISGSLGLIIFATYPVAPPRLANLGLVDTVTQRSSAYRVLQPPAFVNQYAAMPSLHVGWDLLVGISVVTAASSLLLKWIGCLMPLLMAGAVVLTANHYLIDGIAGAALALVGLAAAVALERRAEAPTPTATVPAPRSSTEPVVRPLRDSLVD